MKRYKKKC